MKAGNKRVLVCSFESLLARATNTSTVKRRTESWLSWDNFSNKGSTSSGEICPTRFYKDRTFQHKVSKRIKHETHLPPRPLQQIFSPLGYHPLPIAWTNYKYQRSEIKSVVNNTSYLRFQLLLEGLRGSLQDGGIETSSRRSAGKPITHSQSLEERDKVLFKVLLG